jgi:membrane-bound serine protease (ClpP class)
VTRGPALLLLAVLWLLAGEAGASTVKRVAIGGDINAAAAEFLERAIRQCEAEHVSALVIELDTPGGYLDATKDIVSDILNAGVPIVVFVSPRGAWAGSAGTFITLAGHVAAMAPGTTIGAAHPVLIGRESQPAPVPEPFDPGSGDREDKDGKGPSVPAPRDVLGEKMENFAAAFIQSIAEQRGRNAEWAIEAVRRSVAITQQRALEKNVIDLVADDMDDLLEKIHGREVKLGSATVVLDTKDARVEPIERTTLDRFYAFLTDPSILSLLLMGGLLGLYLEFNAPGAIIPGALGALCLLLAGFGMQAIPFNALGIVLMAGGMALMAAEIFVPTFGVLFASGIVALGVGGYILFDVPELGAVAVPFWSVLFPALAVIATLGGFAVFQVSRSFRAPAFAGAGAEGLIGQVALADSEIAPTGRVFLHGEYWNAEAEEPIRRGERVRVEAIRDLVLRVRRSPDPGGTA